MFQRRCGTKAIAYVRVSNSNCSVGHMRTYKVTAGHIMTLMQQ